MKLGLISSMTTGMAALTLAVVGVGSALGYQSVMVDNGWVSPEVAELAPHLSRTNPPPTLIAPLDYQATEPHNGGVAQGRVVREIHIPRFVCGKAEAMAGVAHGRPHAEYGRVQKCEWM